MIYKNKRKTQQRNELLNIHHFFIKLIKTSPRSLFFAACCSPHSSRARRASERVDAHQFFMRPKAKNAFSSSIVGRHGVKLDWCWVQSNWNVWRLTRSLGSWSEAFGALRALISEMKTSGASHSSPTSPSALATSKNPLFSLCALKNVLFNCIRRFGRKGCPEDDRAERFLSWKMLLVGGKLLVRGKRI